MVIRSGLQVVGKVQATCDGEINLLVNLFEILCLGLGILHLGGLDSRGTIVLRQGKTLVLWTIYKKEVMRLAGSQGWYTPAEASDVVSWLRDIKPKPRKKCAGECVE